MDTSQLQQFLVHYVLAVITGSELNKESLFPLSKCGLVAANYLLYAFFWVIPRLLNFVWQRFGTLCPDLPGYEVGTECSEALAYKIQKSGNYPEESIQHSEQGESLKSRKLIICPVKTVIHFKYSVHS